MTVVLNQKCWQKKKTWFLWLFFWDHLLLTLWIKSQHFDLIKSFISIQCVVLRSPNNTTCPKHLRPALYHGQIVYIISDKWGNLIITTVQRVDSELITWHLRVWANYSTTRCGLLCFPGKNVCRPAAAHPYPRWVKHATGSASKNCFSHVGATHYPSGWCLNPLSGADKLSVRKTNCSDEHFFLKNASEI